MPRHRVVIFDDEISPAAVNGSALLSLEAVVFPHADDWRSSLRDLTPVAVLLDGDMGEHARGWHVCAEIVGERPDVPVVCISRNPLAIVAMEWVGAAALAKELIPHFLTSLDDHLQAGMPPTSGDIRRIVLTIGQATAEDDPPPHQH